jgi:type 1 glutamine amidotransferase
VGAAPSLCSAEIPIAASGVPNTAISCAHGRGLSRRESYHGDELGGTNKSLALAVIAGAVLMLACGSSAGARPTPSQISPTPVRLSVLAFSRTTGFRHDSIPAAIELLRRLGADNGFDVTATEDPAVFTDSSLRPFKVVVFLLTTGTILDADQKAAFERFIGRGGGFVGVHSAADTEYDWPWYGQLLGAWFRTHPALQQATVTVEDSIHPSTARLPNPWVRTDEWYEFRNNPRPAVHVLLAVNEASYKGGGMGADHPIAWCHEFGGGRSWYTALGHPKESYTNDEAFAIHVLAASRGHQAGRAGADLSIRFL